MQYAIGRLVRFCNDVKFSDKEGDCVLEGDTGRIVAVTNEFISVIPNRITVKRPMLRIYVFDTREQVKVEVLPL